MTRLCDLLIIGGGPAGLSAAINGASEGLDVCLLDGGTTFGGQARESNAIENYPGFPDGVTGDELMTNLVSQAYKFSTDMHCPVNAVGLVPNDTDGTILVRADDFSEYAARSVILSLGLTYRRLQTKNVSRYVGHGVYYGLPTHYATDLSTKCNYTVIGGANSAGQAVMHLAKNKNAAVNLVIRGKIEQKMSKYLIDRIRAAENVNVYEGAEITAVEGENGRLRECHMRIGTDGTTKVITCKCMFIFIGAQPRTFWLEGMVELDMNKYIKTWMDISDGGTFMPLPYETSIKGVFCAGDVRFGSTKRVASAVGEGATALQMCHKRLSKGE